MQLQSAINDFLHHCAVERQLSGHTIQAYTHDLADFAKWLLARGVVTDVSTEVLKAYLENMVERKRAVATVRRRLACLRGFFRRLGELGHATDPFIGWQLKLPRRKRLPRALSRTEIRSLLSALGCSAFHRQGDADLRIAVRLMVATGLRVGELCKLRVEDISPDGASLRVHGKGSRDRIVYVTDPAFRAELRALLGQRRGAAIRTAPLLLNSLGSTMRPQSIRASLRRVAQDAGLPRRITPHMLRHTAATLLIETGVDIRMVQRLLGHSSIATTEIYTHVSDEALRTTLERANVLEMLAVR